MLQAVQTLVQILRGAWGSIMGMLLAAAMLAMLAELLRLTGSSVLGASMLAARAIGSILSLIIVVLYAYLAIPAVVHAASAAAVNGGACGPAAELGQAAAYAMAGITSLRMAKAAFLSMFSALSGVSRGVSAAISEAAEAVVGMLFISLAVPVAAAFLGAC